MTEELKWILTVNRKATDDHDEAQEEAHHAKVRELTAQGIPAGEAHARALGMVEWHRREEKSSWWEYFRLCRLQDTELQEDKNALGGSAI